MSLFDSALNPEPANRAPRPLADRMRPRTLDEFMGQEHLVGAGQAAAHADRTDDLASMIFWGPPGVGKTTLAKIIARMTTHADVHRVLCCALAGSRKSNR